VWNPVKTTQVDPKQDKPYDADLTAQTKVIEIKLKLKHLMTRKKKYRKTQHRYRPPLAAASCLPAAPLHLRR
jgi:hypothetical protein